MPFSIPKYIPSILVKVILCLGITFLVILLTADILFEFKPLRRLESALIDVRFQQRGQDTTVDDSSIVIIVEISQESFKSVNEKWPWPKTYFSRLIRNLKRAGAKAVGIDIVFSSLDTKHPEADEDFKLALKETDFVVLAGRLETEQKFYTIRSQHENYGNVFIDSTSRIGLVNTRPDDDNILRRYMPFAVDPATNQRIPMFSMSVLNVFFDQHPTYTAELENEYFLYINRKIPRFDYTTFLINYSGPSGTFRRMKFVDIIDDSEFKTVEEDSLGEDINTFDDPESGYLYDGTFKDKIVLIGSTMPEDKDLFSVPIAAEDGGTQMYGVEVHANVIHSILTQKFITKQPFVSVVLVAFLFCAITIAIITALKSVKKFSSIIIEVIGIFIVFAEIAIVLAVSIFLFNNYEYLLNMTAPILSVTLGYVGSTVYSYLTERKQKVMIKNMFSHYVSQHVVNELIEHPEKLRLGGEKKNLTVFFSDIEGFTNFAEKMNPEELVTTLNEYLTSMTSIIFSNDGTLDKYAGDAIMAFWGAPIPQPDHSFRACRAAIEMQSALKDIREKFDKEKKPQIRVRMGINSGEMIVGNMGGINRFEYTVIGDSVNLGARLETANKQYRTNIIIGENTYNNVYDQVIARELDLLVVVGKTQPVRVYELINLRNEVSQPQLDEFLEYYHKGLSLYRNREWKKAIEFFQKGLEIFPNDFPSQMYIERSRLYQVSPPPDDWNGVFVLKSK